VTNIYFKRSNHRHIIMESTYEQKS